METLEQPVFDLMMDGDKCNSITVLEKCGCTKPFLWWIYLTLYRPPSLLFPLGVSVVLRFGYRHLSGFSPSPASYSQYISEDGRSSSGTRPGSSGSGQTYTPTLTPTPTHTTTSTSPSNNAAPKTGKSCRPAKETFSHVESVMERYQRVAFLNSDV